MGNLLTKAPPRPLGRWGGVVHGRSFIARNEELVAMDYRIACGEDFVVLGGDVGAVVFDDDPGPIRSDRRRRRSHGIYWFEQDKTLRQKIGIQRKHVSDAGETSFVTSSLRTEGKNMLLRRAYNEELSHGGRDTSKVKRQWAREKFGNSDKKDDTTQTAEKADKQEEEKEPGFSRLREAKDYVKGVFKKVKRNFLGKPQKREKPIDESKSGTAFGRSKHQHHPRLSEEERTRRYRAAFARKKTVTTEELERKLKELSDLNKQAQERRNRQAEKRQNE